MQIEREAHNCVQVAVFVILTSEYFVPHNDNMHENDQHEESVTEEEIRLALRNYIEVSWRIFEKTANALDAERKATLPSEDEAGNVSEQPAL